jgi:hypothetical protein
VFDWGAVARFRLSFKTVGLPTLETVMSIPLFLLGENQSIIQRLMLCFELGRVHKFEP